MGHAGITNPYFIVFIILINALSVLIMIRFRRKREISEERSINNKKTISKSKFPSVAWLSVKDVLKDYDITINKLKQHIENGLPGHIKIPGTDKTRPLDKDRDLIALEEWPEQAESMIEQWLFKTEDIEEYIKTRNKIPGESFKNLDMSFLKLQAKRWVDRHSEAKIERVVLYRQASLFQKHLNGNVPSKYFVAFEVSANSNTDELESDTEYYETVPQGFKGLMGADFVEVYQNQPPPNDFKNEWTFFVKKPSNELPADVMVNEPFWVLYP